MRTGAGMGPIPIVGAGGIGTALGYALASQRIAVHMIETNPAKCKAGTVGVEGVGTIQVPFIRFDDWQPQPGALVILATKCYDNAAVLARLPADVHLLPVQNGFEAELESRRVACEGIASFVSECSKTIAHTHITRPGELHIGARNEGEIHKAVAYAYRAWKAARLFRVRTVPDILPIKHTKLMYNAAISPVAAAAGIDNGSLLLDRDAQRIFFALLQENYRILEAAGKPLGKVGPFHPRTVAKILARPWLAKRLANHFARSLRGTYCSMAGEIETGRTEMEHYTGYLLKLAHGTCAAPLNTAINERVRGMTAPDRRVLQEWSALAATT
jgi:2-dehydropantoate 2-reductase